MAMRTTQWHPEYYGECMNLDCMVAHWADTSDELVRRCRRCNGPVLVYKLVERPATYDGTVSEAVA